jgi:hypothetical protein
VWLPGHCIICIRLNNMRLILGWPIEKGTSTAPIQWLTKRTWWSPFNSPCQPHHLEDGKEGKKFVPSTSNHTLIAMPHSGSLGRHFSGNQAARKRSHLQTH